jgi:hypothetical protein
VTKVEKYAKTYLPREIREIENSGRNSETHELTIFEKAVIYKYSNDGFEALNEQLRESKGKIYTEFGKLLDAVLSKLPDYEGLVYRGGQLTSRELAAYQVAFDARGLISEPVFGSTRPNRNFRVIGIKDEGDHTLISMEEA